jgi:filamentous hemagglutinin family protein
LNTTKSITFGLAVLALIASARIASAEITVDGTLGPPAGLGLTNGRYVVQPDGNGLMRIEQGFGRKYGANLFHSFGVFDVANGQTALFESSGITNIISRVTGGKETTIDGVVRSGIAGANFWFVNPAGITIGPNGAIDVSGALAIGAADYIKFADGKQWYALGNGGADASALTVNPTDFGFVTNTMAGELYLNGFELIEVPGNGIGDLVFAGGKITIKDSSLETFGYRESESLTGNPLSAGDIRITSNGSLLIADNSTIASGNSSDQANPQTNAASGDILISAGGLMRLEGDSEIRIETRAGTVDSALVRVTGNDVEIVGTGEAYNADFNLSSLNDASNPKLTIEATRNLTMTSATVISQNQSAVSGPANDIVLKAGNSIRLNGTSIGAVVPGSPGTVGDIELLASSVTLTSSTLSTSTTSATNAGNITVGTATSVVELNAGALLSATTSGAGAAGNIDVRGSTIALNDGAVINAQTSALGDAGNVTVTGGAVTSNGATITSKSETSESGSAGTVTILGDTIHLTDTEVSATTESDRADNEVGSIVIGTATSAVELSNSTIGVSAGTTSGLGRSGAGDIDIKGSTIALNDGAVINAQTSAFGDAGNVTIAGGAVTTSSSDPMRPVIITSRSETSGSGSAGTVTILGDTIHLTDTEVSATTESDRADNEVGSIVIGTATSAVELNAGALLSATTSGAGAAGNIDVRGSTISLTNGAEINAQTFGFGDAGNVTIAGGAITTSSSDPTRPVIITSRSETSESGSAGTVTILGDTIHLTDTEVSATTESDRADNEVGSIVIGTATSAVELNAGALLSATTSGAGAAGNIDVRGSTIALNDGAVINAQTSALGDAGNVTVTGGAVTSNGATITSKSETSESGSAGTVTILGDTIHLTDTEVSATTESDRADNEVGSIVIGTATSAVELSNSTIGVSAGTTSGLGRSGAGDIDIKGSTIALNDGAVINAQTSAFGDAGNVTIAGGAVTTSSSDPMRPVIITSRSETSGSGSAGTVTILGDTIHLTDTEVSATTESDRADNEVGSIVIGTATSAVELNAGALLSATTSGAGAAGNIDVRGSTISLTNGAEINAQTFGFGDAGNVTIAGGAITTSRSETSESGSAGTVTILGDTIHLTDTEVSATTESDRADNEVGSIVIGTATSAVELNAGALLSATTSGAGAAGNIDVRGSTISLTNGAEINAQTFGFGDAGNVTIAGGAITTSSSDPTRPVIITSRSETSESGSAGTVTILGDTIHLTDTEVSATTESDRADNEVGSIVIGTATSAVELSNSTIGVSAGTTSGLGRSGAGDIDIKGSTIALNDGAVINAQTSAFGDAGNVTIAGGAVTTSSSDPMRPVIITSRSETSGSGSAGTVTILGDTIHLTDTEVSATTESNRADNEVGNINIGAETSLVELSAAGVTAETTGASAAGDIAVQGRSVSISGGELTASTTAGGEAGDISVTATQADANGVAALQVRDGAKIRSTAVDGTASTANAGTVALTASQGTVLVAGTNRNTTISTSAGSNAGAAGAISLTGANVSVSDAELSTTVASATQGALVPATITLEASGAATVSNSLLTAETTGGAAGGDVKILGDSVLITAASTLSSETTSLVSSAGPAGNVLVSTLASDRTLGGSAGDSLKAELPAGGGITIDASELSTSTFGSGVAGTVTVNAAGAMLLSQATIKSASTSSSTAAGAAGSITLIGNSIAVVKGSTVSAEIQGGTAGLTPKANITVASGAADMLLVQDSQILTNADQADGGDIAITADGPQFFLQGSQIVTSAGTDGTGNGGNISITHAGDVIVQKSQILARAGAGDGGNITILNADPDQTSLFIQDTESLRSADSAFGNNGEIIIDSPDVDVSAAVLAQTIELAAPPELSANVCTPSNTAVRSTFVREGRGGVPPAADDYLVGHSSAMHPAAASAQTSDVVRSRRVGSAGNELAANRANGEMIGGCQ